MTESGKAQGQATHGGSSPRKIIKHLTSVDPPLNLSVESLRISMPSALVEDHGEQ
jgi:hypothetical protein